MKSIGAVLLAVGLSAVSTWAAAEIDLADNPAPVQWRGPDGEWLPFGSHQEALDFLTEARVASHGRVGKGLNNPLKVLLERNGLQAHAIFRSVKIFKKRALFAGNRVKLNFRDDALFEVAAYRLARLLQMEEIPPTVERTINGRRGSLQLWIENARTEKERVADNVKPRKLELWRKQLQILMLFDNLIFNEDRNQGNILFDPDWNLWLVDHTRSFRQSSQLLRPQTFHLCEEQMWRALQRLDRKTIQSHIGRFLTPSELRGLLARREAIVEKLRRLIEKRGPQLVLFSRSPSRKGRERLGYWGTHKGSPYGRALCPPPLQTTARL